MRKNYGVSVFYSFLILLAGVIPTVICFDISSTLQPLAIKFIDISSPTLNPTNPNQTAQAHIYSNAFQIPLGNAFVDMNSKCLIQNTQEASAVYQLKNKIAIKTITQVGTSMDYIHCIDIKIINTQFQQQYDVTISFAWILAFSMIIGIVCVWLCCRSWCTTCCAFRGKNAVFIKFD